MSQKITLESLPVELIADILGELDIDSLIQVSYLSHRLHDIVSDSSLNPWRRPILRALRSGSYLNSPILDNLSVRTTVARQNWIEILTLANPSFLLYRATLPNLRDSVWEECFNRRFLPGWKKWKKGTWKEAFLKMLHRIWHRSLTTCTVDEAWTKYVVLNRNYTANELEASSRNFNPLVLFNEMKLQNNLAHLETRVRLVVELADVRILAFGTLNRPRTTLTINPNAKALLHPPGIDSSYNEGDSHPVAPVTDHGVYPLIGGFGDHSVPHLIPSSVTYTRMAHPLPAVSHSNYPWHTPGGGDKRWVGCEEDEEEGLQWVGPLMIIAQLLAPQIHDVSGDWPPLQDLDLVVGPGRHRYASFTWNDLWAIAPWMAERISKKIDGPGLGI